MSISGFWNYREAMSLGLATLALFPLWAIGVAIPIFGLLMLVFYFFDVFPQFSSPQYKKKNRKGPVGVSIGIVFTVVGSIFNTGAFFLWSLRLFPLWDGVLASQLEIIATVTFIIGLLILIGGLWFLISSLSDKNKWNKNK